MANQTDLDQVWFVVSPLNPFKSSSSLLHEFDRFKMVELAIQDNFKFRASDVEFNMPRPSYTADTLAYMTDKHPDHNFKLIIGEDNLLHFHKWKNHQVILEQHGLYVYPRPQVDQSKIKVSHEHIKYVDSPMLDISATFIRSSIRNEHSVQYLLPQPVEAYIKMKKFYH